MSCQQAGQNNSIDLGNCAKFANFNIWYLRCHAGDEMSNCIAKTCRTKLLGTPLLKTHRRVSAKCVTYSGTAWKFQQAQRSSAALGHRVHYIEKHLCGTKILGTQLGKSVQPLPSRPPKRFHNAMLQKTQGKEGKPRKATFVTQRFLGHNCWLPRCAHVRVPRYMSKRTAAREPWLRSRVRVNVPVF